ncbi:methionine adenosyltransferase [Breznakibacter xylanolyticus]|uniref:S-adenosylmethionine synthase n=1 Tax=Breznakibacter xylanolyticus TaxID=990 RepID=A0A2W7N853_9BACT|nr:methionine adenosyltransferase [Breznakibacter xylanolyticus]MBN2743136.1 methionine adenosyltransferase [Marinilabiliaceae bacterium]PZX15883.1 methionine adenosyltransferase [Breznakibacter xylanolyticus]
MAYLFTSESVSEGHPDKVADQISDAILDEILRQDSESKVACETLVTTGLVVVSGEIKTSGYVPVQQVARRVIERIGYTKAEYMFDSGSCGVISALHEQSADINRGVEREDPDNQGAGDQGMMFGYACRETEEYMPLPLYLSHLLLIELAAIRREGKEMTYLRPDSKSQVTLEYTDDNKPKRIHTIVISTQHDDFSKPKDKSPEAARLADHAMLAQITDDVKTILIPRVKSKLHEELHPLFDNELILHVNPTGKFVIGGPHGDTGLTGRKIIVDTYGGKGAHGGGAFSGKDSSKVDRSAAYAVRHIAKNLVAAGVADEALVQVAYAIGVAKPVGLYVNTYGTAKVNLNDGEIAAKLNELFDLRPAAIVKRFGLKNPIFEATAAYGHMGRKPYKADVTFIESGKEVLRQVEFFAWEKLDYVEAIKKSFNL